MRCPRCQHAKSRVLDTRKYETHSRRRRECEQCHRRFTTYERAACVYPTIVKQDGRKEPFDRDKLTLGIRKACAGRAFSEQDIEAIADWVVDRVQHAEKLEISSRMLGELVLEKLRDIDPIAYLLFAVVYLPLPDLYSIQAEIERLQSGTWKDHLWQPWS